MFTGNAFADRDTATVTTYRSSQLVKRGNAKIYSASFVATAAGGDFIILNAVSDTTLTTGAITDVKAEGREATSNNSQFQDFTKKPLEMSTGIYVVVNSGYLTLQYE